MKFQYSALLALATSASAAPPTKSIKEVARQASDACSSAVTLDPSENPFKTRTLHPNIYYREEVDAAVKNISDATLAAEAAKVADVGTFLWIDTMANIAKIDKAVTDVPCDHILGLVIYDLPGRDCAAKASNGELKVGQLDTYKSQYIDPIVTKLKKYDTVAFALVIEPDSLPNLVTNMDKTACANSADGYENGIAYAIKNLNLPNVIMYIDAGHGGWLGWNANLKPGAKEISKVYKMGGSPAQVRGFSTNVAGWNSWDQTPGEFSTASDAKYDKCQNEEIYVDTFSPLLKADGMPGYAIVDTSRDGVTGLRKAWGDWCNVNGAGFGVRPSADTGDDLADAFVWVKPGGESDGTSDPNADRYDSFCGKSDAFKPSPQAGQWNQAYFEMLVKNANPAF